MNRAAAALLLVPGAAVALSVMACRTPPEHVPSRPAHHSSTETAAPTSHPNTHGSYSSGHSTPSKPCVTRTHPTTPPGSTDTGVASSPAATTPTSRHASPSLVLTSALTTAHLTSASPPKGGIGTGAATSRPVPVLAETGSRTETGLALGLGFLGVGGLTTYAGRRRTKGTHR